MDSENRSTNLGKRPIIQPSFALSHGSLVVMQKLSHWCCFPFIIQKIEYSDSRLIAHLGYNESYTKTLNWCIRNIFISIRLFILWFSLFRLIWLKFNWNAYERLQQMFLYMILFCMGGVVCASYFTINQYFRELFLFILNQRIKLVPIQRCHSVTIGDRIIYQFAIGCSAFGFILFFLPFKLDYEIGSLIFYNLVGTHVSSLPLIYKLPIQLILGTSYFIIELYGTFYFLTLILGAVTFVEGIPFLTSQLIANKSRAPATVQFRKILKVYKITQILISQANEAIHKFLFIMAILGVIFAGWCSFGTLLLYNELPILTYLSCPVLVCICFFVDFVLIYFASIPNKHSKAFKSVWEVKLKNKEDRKSLRSCLPIGFNIGPLRRIDLCMSLKIADCIVNCTVNLVLVKLHSV